ncbi:GNAT family N-acetyltransferase [Streptomyces sp. NPDC090445]|uniref:GNAT family N-acetyltransferase n=1 Tax=Streptomyces sp. NPDC090445 TaxID=3365963 RepID=UPI0038153E58
MRAATEARYAASAARPRSGFGAATTGMPWRCRSAQRVFHHTEVDAAFAGQGLASLLLREALADVRRSGMRVVPVCPYMAAYLERHPEFGDLADPVTPEVLRWLDAELA